MSYTRKHTRPRLALKAKRLALAELAHFRCSNPGIPRDDAFEIVANKTGVALPTLRYLLAYSQRK